MSRITIGSKGVELPKSHKVGFGSNNNPNPAMVSTAIGYHKLFLTMCFAFAVRERLASRGHTNPISLADNQRICHFTFRPF